MRSIWTVVKFTMRDLLTRKSYRISTLIILILIVLGFNVPNFLKSINGGDFTDTILVIDENNIFDGKLESLNNAELGYKLEVSHDDYDTIKAKIESGDISSAVIIEDNRIRYIVENTATSNGFPQGLVDGLNALYTNIQIHKLGLTANQIQSLTPPFEYSFEQTQVEEIHGNIFVMMLMSVVLFYAIYFCAYQVSSSITTEKTSKIMETLVTSTSPTTIILGKTLGIGLVGLIQMVLIVGTAVVSANLFLDRDMLAAVLDLSNFTPYLALITIAYFILGYFMYAFIYALTGSTVSKPEDIQAANTPVAILSMVGFYLAYFTLTDPTSSLNVFAALFPISSPFCMPIRILMGLASGWEVALSIIILVITIYIIARIAIKIYSNAILNYGAKMNLSSLLKAYKEK